MKDILGNTGEVGSRVVFSPKNVGRRKLAKGVVLKLTPTGLMVRADDKEEYESVFRHLNEVVFV